MKRIHKLSIAALLLFVIWVVLCSSAASAELQAPLLWVVYTLPLLTVALFGLYALLLLIHGVCTFRTVPSEAEKLKQDIEEAFAFLRRKGIPYELPHQAVS
jgi:succinate dehydrogenase/fumarate reductase cytochrome b subunit